MKAPIPLLTTTSRSPPSAVTAESVHAACFSFKIFAVKAQLSEPFEELLSPVWSFSPC